jgi:hypothetical protein
MFLKRSGVFVMQLLIENELRTFIPIKTFRATHGLPDEFGIGFFEPKDYAGLGRIDKAGADLNEIRPIILDAIPTRMPLEGWLGFLPDLSRLFQNKLDEMNPQVGLKSAEIEFAVSGFSDVCHALVYGMIRAHAGGQPFPSFQQIYTDWLNTTVKISTTVHSYLHIDAVWPVQIVNTAFGRTGLIIWTDSVTYYVEDTSLACPADGFMFGLLNEVAARIIAATEQPSKQTEDG